MKIRAFALILAVGLFHSSSLAQVAAVMPGEVIIQLEKGANSHEVEAAFEQVAGIQPRLKAVREISAPMRAWLFSFDPEQIRLEEMLRLLSTTDGVQIAQANHRIAERETIPDDPFFGNQWHHVDGEDNDIDSDLAWDVTTGGITAAGDEIVVCVVETQGTKWDQADIVDNHWVNTGEIPSNGVDDDENGYVDDYDGWNITNDTDNIGTGNHGTQVSSMIGAKGNNATGITGVNWDVKLMQVQMGNISEANVIEAYTYPLVMRRLYNETNGDRGAFVVATNSSWGTDFGQPANAPLWCAMYDSLGYYGVLSCGATSNSELNVDEVGDLPTACPSDYLISVTATNNNDVRTFAGYGLTTIDLGAPGEQVYLAGNNNYGNTSGTSFASPCTAGAIALLYSAPCSSLIQIAYSSPATAAELVKGYILDGTDAVTALQGEVVTGGRLNVNNALLLLLGECSSGGCIAPFAVTAGAVGASDDVLISWSGTDAMLSFTLRYREEGAPEWTVVGPITANSYLLEDLPYCTTYEFQVNATCEEGTSDWTSSAFFTSEGCCENPDDLALTSVGATNASITWNSILAATSYVIQLSADGVLVDEVTGLTGTSYTFANLTPCTAYSVTVLTICEDGSAQENTTLSFNTTGCGSCQDLEYCEISADAGVEWIAGVTLNTINNTSGSDDGYGDYTDLSTTLSAGQSYPITCTPGFDGFSYSEYFMVWIDYNSNGSFEENELAFDPGTASPNAVSGTIAVPSWVQDGNVRMRVSMSYMGTFGGGDLPMSCGAMEYGEAEDYCIQLTNDVLVAEEDGAAVLTIWPNPASALLRVITDGAGTMQIYDPTGRLVHVSTLRGSAELGLEDYPVGMYTLRYIPENGHPVVRRFVRE